MCGRYSWKQPSKRAFTQLVEEAPQEARPSYNRAPGQVHPTLSVTGQTVAWTPMWWARPANGDSSGNKLFPINARSETVTDKPIFCESFRQRRCLVPADGFYEWESSDDGKYPYFIHLPGGSAFAMAGIWRNAPDGNDPGLSFCILTRSAHPSLLHLHHRMPLLVVEEDRQAWLDPSTPQARLSRILEGGRVAMDSYQVSKRVNATRNDDPRLQDASGERQATLF